MCGSGRDTIALQHLWAGGRGLPHGAVLTGAHGATPPAPRNQFTPPVIPLCLQLVCPRPHAPAADPCCRAAPRPPAAPPPARVPGTRPAAGPGWPRPPWSSGRWPPARCPPTSPAQHKRAHRDSRTHARSYISAEPEVHQKDNYFGVSLKVGFSTRVGARTHGSDPQRIVERPHGDAFTRVLLHMVVFWPAQRRCGHVAVTCSCCLSAAASCSRDACPERATRSSDSSRETASLADSAADRSAAADRSTASRRELSSSHLWVGGVGLEWGRGLQTVTRENSRRRRVDGSAHRAAQFSQSMSRGPIL
jgi:hypothetical protein